VKDFHSVEVTSIEKKENYLKVSFEAVFVHSPSSRNNFYITVKMSLISWRKVTRFAHFTL
jgi:hypothetical protein